MKLLSVLPVLTGATLVLAATVSFAAASSTSTAAAYTTQEQKLGYTLGYDMGKGLAQQGVSVNITAFNAGYAAANSNATPALTQDQMKAATDQYRQVVMASMKKQQEAQQAKLTAESASNATASHAFLAKVAQQKGVMKISDGVYYKVITAGKGPMPTASDTVTVNYEGSLMNGKVFDSSYARHQPASIPLNAVIPGWTTALTHMPVGSTWTIYLSPEQAYGKEAPAVIGPNQTLIFKVELIKIDAPAAPAASAVAAK